MKQILVVEPSVHICVNDNNEVLFYNTYNYNFLYYKDSNIVKIARTLLSENNNYVIYLQNKNTKIEKKFIDELIANNMGFVHSLKNTMRKPIQLYPISAVQKSSELNDEDYSILIRKNILKHLNEATVYFNRVKSGVNNHILHKQFVYPILDENNSEIELTIENIIHFFESIKYSSLKNINIVGSNLLNFNGFSSLVSYLSSFNANKRYFLRLSEIVFDNFMRIKEINPEDTTIVLTIFADSELNELERAIISLQNLNLNFQFRCAVASEMEAVFFKELFTRYKISNYHIIPYLDNTNFRFFCKNVFLTFEEVLELQNSMINIHTNEHINPLFFGKICLMPVNSVRSDIHSENPIGYNDDNFVIQEALYIALSTENSWRLTRNKVESCKDCVARNICTPISNYEIMLQKYKICEQQ